MLLEGFEGIYPAAVSPRDSEGEFSEKAMELLVTRLYEADVNGLYMCGNTGEGYLMTPAERKQAAEISVAGSDGKGKVVIHVGAPAERDALELAKHAAEIGADAISSLPPYVQGYKFEEILAYYSHLAEVSGLPTFVYYIPVVTHQEFSLAQVDEMLGLDGVAGLKFTNHNLFLMEGILQSSYSPHVFNGHDEVMLAGLAMGAQGGIGSFYNLMPRNFVGIYEAVKQQDLAAGRQLQSEVNQMIRIAQQYGMHGTIRAVLKWQGIDCGDPVLPTLPLEDASQVALKADLISSGLAEILGVS